MTILVTGATGNLGGALVNSLRRRGLGVRAASRDPKKVEARDGVTAVKAVFEDPSTFDAALDGAEGLFLIAPPADPDAEARLGPVIERAKAAGTKHVVFNSAFGADRNEDAPLGKVERLLRDSGAGYTILRPNFFMENFSSGYLAPSIKQQRSIFLPAGDAKTSFIAVRDIAETAAAVFADRRTGGELNLTGPEALDHSEVARIISDAAGMEVKYHPLSEAEMRFGAQQMGVPEPTVAYMLMLYAAVRKGYTAPVTDDVKRATGRDPLSFAQFARENAAAWQ
ncbi:MAG: SDR family oxidoreductase [Bryobacteraceae bacterium]|nr:SDR family oxidoreductase [Bryobacteraceae bacterium]